MEALFRRCVFRAMQRCVFALLCVLAVAAHAQVVTEFSAGSTPGQLVGIATGPDGSLWFTEQFGNRIGRLTPGPPAPALLGAASRNVHGVAGTFDLPLQ